MFIDCVVILVEGGSHALDAVGGNRLVDVAGGIGLGDDAAAAGYAVRSAAVFIRLLFLLLFRVGIHRITFTFFTALFTGALVERQFPYTGPDIIPEARKAVLDHRFHIEEAGEVFGELFHLVLGISAGLLGDDHGSAEGGAAHRPGHLAAVAFHDGLVDLLEAGPGDFAANLEDLAAAVVHDGVGRKRSDTEEVGPVSVLLDLGLNVFGILPVAVLHFLADTLAVFPDDGIFELAQVIVKGAHIGPDSVEIFLGIDDVLDP